MKCHYLLQEHKVREKFKEALEKEFADSGLVFAIGGQISIDVFPVGWSKVFCLQFLEKYGFSNIHFFGDKTAKVGHKTLASFAMPFFKHFSCSVKKSIMY